MKTASLVVSSLLCVSVCAASESHDVDRGIESSLRATLNDRHVHFHAHNGIVTIDGRVRNIDERQRIEDLVRRTSGVVAVQDDLKVTSPSPGTSPEYPPRVPVYTSAAPEVIPATPVVTRPPFIVPNYPTLKIEAWSTDDEPAAHRIARQLQVDAVPASGLDTVKILVRDGNVSLQGVVDSHASHDLLIASLQRAGGARAIYDELRVR